MLERLTGAIATSLIGSNSTTGTKIEILSYITDPVVDSIIEVCAHPGHDHVNKQLAVLQTDRRISP